MLYEVITGGRHKLADHHDSEDREQHQRDFVPGELVDGGVKHDTDAAGADEAEHRRFANVDIPAINDGAINYRQHLRDHADDQSLQARSAGCFDGLDRSLVDLLDSYNFV